MAQHVVDELGADKLVGIGGGEPLADAPEDVQNEFAAGRSSNGRGACEPRPVQDRLTRRAPIRSRRSLGGLVAAGLAGRRGRRGRSPGTTAGRSPASTTTSTSATVAVVGHAGGPGVGDPYFPDLGNGGYDVDHYDLDLTWRPDDGRARGGGHDHRHRHAGPVQLRPRPVGARGPVGARSTAPGPRSPGRRRELVDHPGDRRSPEGSGSPRRSPTTARPKPIDRGRRPRSTWGGRPSAREVVRGLRAERGGHVLPRQRPPVGQGDVPLRGHGAQRPGRRRHERRRPRAHRRAATAPRPGSPRSGEPMASYLVQVAIGDFGWSTAAPAGRVCRSATSSTAPTRTEATAALARTAEMIDVLDDVWGPYPFEVYGVLAVDEPARLRPRDADPDARSVRTPSPDRGGRLDRWCTSWPTSGWATR